MTPQTLEEVICQAGLSWLITDVDGVPLRYGKGRRYPTADQRRVLRVRDGGCRWPACDARPEWCIVHHEPPFDEPGGRTDLDAMALICPTHHGLRHHAGWTLDLHPDATVTVTAPHSGHTRTETAAHARKRHDAAALDAAGIASRVVQAIARHVTARITHRAAIASEAPATDRPRRAHPRPAAAAPDRRPNSTAPTPPTDPAAGARCVRPARGRPARGPPGLGAAPPSAQPPRRGRTRADP